MEDKCIVFGCRNHKHEGQFEGDICKPCYIMITTGQSNYGTNFIVKLFNDKENLKSIIKEIKQVISNLVID
jgi:hypothetical protein